MKFFQKTAYAYYFFQLTRYGAFLLVSIWLAWQFPNHPLIDAYERLLLLGSAVTFFWVSALFDSYLTLMRKEYPGGGWIRSVWSVGLPMSVGAGLATWLIGYFTLPPAFQGSAIGYGLFVFGESMSLMLVNYLYHNGRNSALWLYGILSPLLYLLGIILPLFGEQGLSASCWTLGLIGLGKMVWLAVETIPLARKENRTDFPLRTLLAVAIPVSLSFLLSRSSELVDGYLVLQFAKDDFALFRYGAKELPLILMVANSFSSLQAARYAAGNQAEKLQTLGYIRHRTILLITGFSAVTAILLLVSKPLFIAVFGPAFADSHLIFDVYLLLVIPRITFPQTILRGMLETRMLTVSAAIELVLNIGLSLLLLPIWGLQGIAMATVIAFMAEKSTLAFYLWRRHGISPWKYTPILVWGSCAGLLVALYVLLQFWHPF